MGPVTEKQRLHLFKTLEQRLGAEDAATMMEMLPPASSSGVATKEDLSALEMRLEAKIDRATTRMITWTLASQTTLVAIVGLLLALD